MWDLITGGVHETHDVTWLRHLHFSPIKAPKPQVIFEPAMDIADGERMAHDDDDEQLNIIINDEEEQEIRYENIFN